MINATQKKLNETHFFFRKLCYESKEVVRREPEAFQYYLSAFLSAARSVTFALQAEEKEKYDAWFPPWLNGRTEEERKLLDFFKTQRNIEQKRGGTQVNIGWEFVPITEVRTDNWGHPAYGFYWSEPPGTPLPQIGLPKYYFELGSSEAEVSATCKRYVDLPNELVQAFIEAHSHTGVG